MKAYDDATLYAKLTELAVISDADLSDCLKTGKERNITFASALLARDLISDENLGKIIADMLNIPFVRIALVSIPADVLLTIPSIVARKQQIIPFDYNEKGLYVAMLDPTNLEVVEFVKKKTGHQVVVHYATEQDIANALALYNKNVKEAFDEILTQQVAEAKGASRAEPSIIKIVDTIINYAYQNKSSDIHIEPHEQYATVRFRIDGILHDIIQLPLTLHPQVVTRVKVLSKLRTDEHHAAQDGKLQHKTEQENVDIRVSIVPIVSGEKIVMRLLSERSRQFSLTDLGIGTSDLAKVKSAYEKPYGMVLATGPTGCGKTTTVYGVLKMLNKRNVNIMTIEDPVEYEIEGVNQIQVNTATQLTFAKGLRSIVRQDPDIILVGEIRDQETASIAINSAMTGHLVLSTLHTNDAATAIPRLFDMGVEPFLAASSVNIIIAQRLVRQICLKCRVSKEVDRSVFSAFTTAHVDTLFSGKERFRMYQGKGCSICHETGYVGRIGIFETLIISEKVRATIIAKSDASIIANVARSEGMTTMIEDGLEKVKRGETTVDEVIRVTKE